MVHGNGFVVPFCLCAVCGVRCALCRVRWAGMEYVKYALGRVWNMPEVPTPRLRGHIATEEFKKHFRGMSPRTRGRLRYFRDFVRTDTLHLVTAYAPTDLDQQKVRAPRHYVHRVVRIAAAVRCREVLRSSLNHDVFALVRRVRSSPWYTSRWMGTQPLLHTPAAAAWMRRVAKC